MKRGWQHSPPPGSRVADAGGAGQWAGVLPSQQQAQLSHCQAPRSLGSQLLGVAAAMGSDSRQPRCPLPPTNPHLADSAPRCCCPSHAAAAARSWTWNAGRPGGTGRLPTAAPRPQCCRYSSPPSHLARPLTVRPAAEGCSRRGRGSPQPRCPCPTNPQRKRMLGHGFKHPRRHAGM